MRLPRNAMDSRSRSRLRHRLVVCLIVGVCAALASTLAAQECDDQEVAPDVVVDQQEVAMIRGEALPRLPDVDVFDLSQRRQALDARALELENREVQLALLRDELDERLQRLAATQAAMDEYLTRWHKIEEADITQLVKVYTAMKPPPAAAAIGAMEERLATNILSRMNEKKAAKIMDLLPSAKAVTIARLMGRGLQ
jgi:flagellar motility protein MotE (MotC chaperone)